MVGPETLCPLCYERGTIRLRDGDGADGFRSWSCARCAQDVPPLYAAARSSALVPLPLMGLPGHGKTVYFGALLSLMRKHSSPCNDADWRRVWELVRSLETGELPPTTPQLLPEPLLLETHGLSGMYSAFASLSDVAGEAFTGEETVRRLSAGMLRSPAVAWLVSPIGGASGQDRAVAELDVGDSLRAALTRYRSAAASRGASIGGQMLVLVWTKADAWYREAGLPDVVREWLEADPARGWEAARQHAEAVSAAMRGWAAGHPDIGPFVREAERHFGKVVHCPVSATGSTPDGRILGVRPSPRGVLGPLFFAARAAGVLMEPPPPAPPEKASFWRRPVVLGPLAALFVAGALVAAFAGKQKSDLVQKFEDLADKACKCKDQDCVSDVTKEFLKLSADNMDEKPTKEEADKIEAATKTYAECVAKAAAARPVKPAEEPAKDEEPPEADGPAKDEDPGRHQLFVRVAKGRFQMGSPGGPHGEEGRFDDEAQHWKTIERDFWLAKTEVTQREWKRVMDGGTPSGFGSCGDECPVENVSWYSTLVYLNRWSKEDDLTQCYTLPPGCTGDADEGTLDCGGRGSVQQKDPCDGYRLPTEAEWEYAARAGTTTAIYTGRLRILGENNGPELDDIAWYGGNSGVEYEGGSDCSGWPEKAHASSRCGPHPVARKKPNNWGLFDMLGNVFEWTWDEYPASSDRVRRGCSWDSDARPCRAAYRVYCPPGYRGVGLGFRPARSILDP